MSENSPSGTKKPQANKQKTPPEIRLFHFKRNQVISKVNKLKGKVFINFNQLLVKDIHFSSGFSSFFNSDFILIHMIA